MFQGFYDERRVIVRDCRHLRIRSAVSPLSGQWGCILVASMSPEEEGQVCNALVNLGWLENDHALHAEGVQSIRDVLQCTLTEAKAVLGELRLRKRIDVAVKEGGEPMPAKLRWIRPPNKG